MSTKILTIDDSKTIRLIVARAFKPFNCTVLEAANGVVGLSVATREKPDLILLDYTMPVMDGYEVLARLRSDPDLKSTPVIMLTAEAGRETVVKIAKLSVRDYLIKPFKEDLLVERASRVISLKPKSDDGEKRKRYDDPIHLLIVDDKPAISAQIRDGLADTNWKLSCAEELGQALDICTKTAVDLVLVSHSLPKDGAYMLFQNLRSVANSAAIPVFALCVKTAVADQTRAQQAGFSGIITKPIDPSDLKSKVCRALGLETSYRYFQERGNALVLSMPKEISPHVAHEITSSLHGRLTGIVDAGGDKLIVDLKQMETANLQVINLVLSAAQACSKLSLKYAVVASDTVKAECRTCEETHVWPFAKTVEEAESVLAK